MMSVGLTRKEKEKLVVELFRQGMTYAQIAKEAHVSLRDIGPILNKTGEYQSLSNSSQAYKMFSEGSTPIQVSVALNLREKDVSEYYREYWNLDGIYQLNQIYEELKDEGIWSVIELHRRIKTEGLSPQQVSRILKTTKTLEHNNRDLECEEARLEVGNKQAAKTFQQLTNLIQKVRKTLEENDSFISQQERDIEKLNMEKTRLENMINSIRLNNETYIKIKQIVRQEIESIVSNPRRLLTAALASLFESSRKYPGKLLALYYNMPSQLSAEQILSQPSISQNASHYGYGEDKTLLLDEAEQIYNNIVNVIANRCINEVSSNYMKSPSQTLQVPGTPEGLSPLQDRSKIFDSRDLSQVNFIYNDITFQVYPDLKITNENEKNTSNEMDDSLIDNEIELHDLGDRHE
jgi:transposase